jgi:hypothetical protein
MGLTPVAIIGTAGRKEDKAYLTERHFIRMLDGVYVVLKKVGLSWNDIQLISGGAAWADHLAVNLVKIGKVSPLATRLYIPARFDGKQYVRDNPSSTNTASTCNYYHSEFSKVISRDSLSEINDIRLLGADLSHGGIGGGFKVRNQLVASACGTEGITIAFTFGSTESPQSEWSVTSHAGSADAVSANVKPGGTSDTWNRLKCLKFHARIGKQA